MKITELLIKERMNLDLKSKTKDDVINEGKSEIFNEWFKKYQEWLKQNKLI